MQELHNVFARGIAEKVFSTMTPSSPPSLLIALSLKKLTPAALKEVLAELPSFSVWTWINYFCMPDINAHGIAWYKMLHFTSCINDRISDYNLFFLWEHEMIIESGNFLYKNIPDYYIIPMQHMHSYEL